MSLETIKVQAMITEQHLRLFLVYNAYLPFNFVINIHESWAHLNWIALFIIKGYFKTVMGHAAITVCDKCRGRANEHAFSLMKIKRLCVNNVWGADAKKNSKDTLYFCVYFIAGNVWHVMSNKFKTNKHDFVLPGFCLIPPSDILWWLTLPLSWLIEIIQL